MTEHKTATREEWDAARKELLEREKEITHSNDELARQRRELPWVRIEKDYTFETDDGSKSLDELFDGRSQLLIYNFMFGPEYTAGCTVCSSIADSVNGVVPHLNADDVTFLCVSRAPLNKLQAYKRRLGWQFPWVSSLGGDFNFDFGASRTREEAASFVEGGASPVLVDLAARSGTDPAGYLSEGPALNAFTLSDGAVYQTYSAYARGLEILMGYYPLLDRVPKGRNEEGQTEFWLRRHDEY
jgi:predicted dithiol-disulfide oxidoreductase (DUF899 family)